VAGSLQRYSFRKSSGNFATLAAIRRASPDLRGAYGMPGITVEQLRERSFTLSERPLDPGARSRRRREEEKSQRRCGAMIALDAHFGSFTVLGVDPTGKRCCVGCRCDGVHVFGAEALRDGSAMCIAAPLSPAQRELLRSEADERSRQFAHRRWK
jgi:hypothetical protein